MSDVGRTMETAGWREAWSGGGCEWYIKEIILPDGRRGFMAITDMTGLSLPTYWAQEVMVGYYDQDMNSYRDGELDLQAKLVEVNLLYTRGDNL
jgi:hypothetical protein